MLEEVKVLAIAHRAGNDLAALAAAVEGGVDLVEADVHVAGRRLELRHLKAAGPLPLLWDRTAAGVLPSPRDDWSVRRRTRSPELAGLLAAADGRVGVMLDLKGAGRVGSRTALALRAAPPSQPVLVCARWWPSIAPYADAPWARPVLSVRGRTELARLRRRVAARPPWGVSLHPSLLTRPLVDELAARVTRVLTWGITDERELERVLSLGVTGVISEQAEVLDALVGDRRRA